LSMKTKTHFAFRVDIWDDTRDSIVEHVAGVDDFEVAEATYRAAVARWPRARITLRQGARGSCMRPTRGSTVPRPRSKPTDPNVKAAAEETAWQHLMRLIIDATSWSMQGMGPTDGPKSRRHHAKLFIENALLPDAGDNSREIARTVALPIMHEVVDGRSSPNARRDQILIDTAQLVCDRHALRPTRTSGESESGCSIVAEVLPKFLAWLHKYPDELLDKFPDLPKYRERRRFADTELRRLPEKFFPEGALSEDRMNNIWDKRSRS
jgi:hypothetical protein